eukprot:7449-Pyramimonas_sp.AAC.1
MPIRYRAPARPSFIVRRCAVKTAEGIPIVPGGLRNCRYRAAPPRRNPGRGCATQLAAAARGLRGL